MQTVYWALAVLAGLVFGSFFNVCIYRIPKKSFLYPTRSACPNCSQSIRAIDNIPILSFVFLRGKCRNCRKPISWLYPGVELFSVSFYCFASWRFFSSDIQHGLPSLVSNTGTFLSYWFFTAILSFLIPVIFIDLKHRIIPDSISLGGGVAAILVSSIPGGISPLDSLKGFFIVGGILYGIALLGDWVLKKETMGGGDIKLVAMGGAILGFQKGMLSLFLGSIFGALMGVYMLIIYKKRDLAFGPALVLGIWYSFWFGDWTIKWYLGLLTS